MTQRNDASPGQAVQEASDSAFDSGRIIALKSVEQTMRDQAHDVGSAYFKYCSSISALTAVPETCHSNGTEACAGLALYHRAGRLRAAV